MTWSLTILAATALCLCAGLILAMRRLASQTLPVTADWLAEFSDGHYRPMLRLLDEGDFRFLRAQRGFQPEMEKRLREQRVRVFRAYLRILGADFRRVCAGVKQLMVETECDRPEVASILMKRQAAFGWGMMVVKFRLALYRYGMARVDGAGLVRMFDRTRVELTTMTLGAEQAPA